MKGVVGILVASCINLGVATDALASDTASIIEYLHSLSRTRESLAATLDTSPEPITQKTFARVCAPVGKELAAWATKTGYSVRQVASKFRNEKNAPHEGDLSILSLFDKDRSLNSEVRVSAGEGNGRAGTEIFVPIRVTESCLHCHGEASARPEFIVKKYPEDRAYGFKAGDLRGMYAVFVSQK